MFKALLSSKPRLAIFVNHMHQQIFGLRGYQAPIGGVKLKILVENIFEYLFAIISFKRWITT
jgi:hypothetical protein